MLPADYFELIAHIERILIQMLIYQSEKY